VEEIWKDISGYEGQYQVSSLGRVKSLDRVIKQKNKKEYHLKGRILSACKNSQGYYTVQLSKGRGKTFKVHGLVADTFLGPRPEGLETLHGKLGKEVNTVDNLKYGTHKENEADKVRDGTSGHVLSNEKILEIRYIYNSNQLNCRQLANLYELDYSQVSNIVLNKSYKHVKELYD